MATGGIISNRIHLGSLKRQHDFVPISVEKRLRESSLSSSDRDVQETAEFITRCLTVDPSLRPTAKELLDDPWFTGI